MNHLFCLLGVAIDLNIMNNLEEFAKWLGIVVATGSAIGSIYWFLKKKIYDKIINYFDLIAESFKKIETITEKITNIDKELTTNGGMTIKDAICRIDKNIFLLEERQKALLTSSKELCYFETDNCGHLITANRYFQQLTNRTLEELLGFGWINTVEIKNRENVRKEWHRCIENVEEYNAIFFVENIDKEKFEVKVEAYPMKHKDGKLAGYIGLMKPIKENAGVA